MNEAQKKAEEKAKADEAQKKAEEKAKADTTVILLCDYKGHKYGDKVKLSKVELEDTTGYRK